MESNAFMDKIRSFFGFNVKPPRNEFRNPIWNIDDDDDDDDELYSRRPMVEFRDPMEFHREFTRQIQEMFSSFGPMFGDMKNFFYDDPMNSFGIEPPMSYEEPEQFSNSDSIRDHYLKPGYQNQRKELEGDKDLDGQVSSDIISGLFKNKDDQITPTNRYDDDLLSKPFVHTEIRTCITKPDGTTEIKKIVKEGNKVVEETITINDPNTKIPNMSEPTEQMMISAGKIVSELVNIFKNFN